MSEVRDPDRDQPLPVASRFPTVHEEVAADLMARQAFGIRKYGRPLQAFNGRQAARDAYEEALDLTAYMRQKLNEDEHMRLMFRSLWNTMRAAPQAPGTGRWRDGYLCALRDFMYEMKIELPTPTHPLGFFDWRDNAEQDVPVRGSDEAVPEVGEVSEVLEDGTSTEDVRADGESAQPEQGHQSPEDGGGDQGGAGSGSGEVDEGSGVLRPVPDGDAGVADKSVYVRGGTRFRLYRTYQNRWGPGRVHLATYDKVNKDYHLWCTDKYTWETNGFLQDDPEPVDCLKCLKSKPASLAGKWGL